MITLATSFAGDGTSAAERFENAILYRATADAPLGFDGNRTATLADDVAISDETDSGIADPATLLAAVGVTPDLAAARPGDRVGDAMPDVVVADLTLDGGKLAAVAVKARTARPLIGIAWTGANVNDSQKRVATAILRNGGRVFFMPRLANDQECDLATSELDGFIMLGGADLDPALYGEAPYPHGSVGIERDRDVSDVLATRRAILSNFPAIWICRGEQTLNVALGGALVQDIPSYQGDRATRGEIPREKTELIPDEGAPTRYDKGPLEECLPRHYRVVAFGIQHRGARHAVDVSESSKFLAPIIGVGGSPTFLSTHHQAADAKRLGAGLTIVATSPDGIVEALEYQANDFALATQFHFEVDAFSDDPNRADVCDRFFRALLRFARERMAARK